MKTNIIFNETNWLTMSLTMNQLSNIVSRTAYILIRIDKDFNTRFIKNIKNQKPQPIKSL